MQDQAQLPPDGSAAGSANQDPEPDSGYSAYRSCQLGRKRLRISELLQVGTGAILELIMLLALRFPSTPTTP